MKKYIKHISVIAIALIILFFILNYKIGFFNKTSEQAGSSPMGQGPVPVDATVVEPQTLENVLVLTGSLLANEYVDLKSEVAGKVTRINFEEGDQVSQGELMVSINDAELRARLEKLKLQRKLYEDNEYRQKVLFEREAISKEEYDVALTELNKSDADIREVEAQLAKTRIYAPFSGIVGLRNVSEGAFINNNTVIANFYDINPIKVQFSVPGRYSHLVKKNQPVTFTVENFDKTFQALVYAIEPQIDPQTRTLTIRAVADNNNKELLPGTFVNISLNLETVDEALMVPNIAVIPELNTHKVYIKKNGKAQAAQVEIGTRTADDIQIIEGISSGDTVIISGILQLREGAPVTISSIN